MAAKTETFAASQLFAVLDTLDAKGLSDRTSTAKSEVRVAVKRIDGEPTTKFALPAKTPIALGTYLRATSVRVDK